MWSTTLLFVGGVAVICLTVYPLLIAKDIAPRAKKYIIALGGLIIFSQIGVWKSDQMEKETLKGGMETANSRLVDLQSSLDKTSNLLHLIANNLPVKVVKSISMQDYRPKMSQKTDWEQIAQKGAEKTNKELFCSKLPLISFFAPNPYVGTTGWFHIPTVGNRTLSLRIYNLVGDLVFLHDFDTIENLKSINYKWPKVDVAGNSVGPGVYFAVIRAADKFKNNNGCQTVIKILVP